MKATDLMIGDWVRQYSEYGDGTSEVIQMGYIRKDYNYTDLEPIPLTPEILEKNADNVYKRCENGYSLFGIGKYPNSIEVAIYPKGGVEWTINGNEYAIADLMYVHELQHALKLCGIEKEIVL